MIKNFLLILTLAWGVMGATYNTCAEYDSLSTTYLAANSGDTVVIRPDTSDWNRTLNITKSIVILCRGGKDSTLIRWIGGTDSSIIKIEPSFSEIENVFRVSGITIDANNIDNIKAVYVKNESYRFIKRLRIDNCKVLNLTGATSFAFYAYGSIYGLVDNNEMPALFKILGYNSLSWTDPLKIGSANYLYIEDNSLATVANRILINSGWGSRWVFRHNTVDLSQRGFNLLDAHGNLGSVRGVVGHAIYENTFINSQDRSDGMRFHDLRGGTAQVYNNTITGSETSSDFQIREEDCTPEGIKCEYPGIDPVMNTYAWNNTNNGSLIPIQNATSNNLAEMILENRDWWDDYGVSDNNFTYGVIADRPVICAVNDCYFATDTRVLYKSTQENQWDSVYAEYEYPHPLQNDENPWAETSSNRKLIGLKLSLSDTVSFGYSTPRDGYASIVGATNYNYTSTYSCPSTGPKRLVYLSAICSTASTGSVRIALYNTNNKLIAQGATAIALGGLATYRHTSFTDSLGVPIKNVVLNGGDNYRIAITGTGNAVIARRNASGSNNVVGIGYATNGFPATLSTGGGSSSIAVVSAIVEDYYVWPPPAFDSLSVKINGVFTKLTDSGTIYKHDTLQAHLSNNISILSVSDSLGYAKTFTDTTIDLIIDSVSDNGFVGFYIKDNAFADTCKNPDSVYLVSAIRPDNTVQPPTITSVSPSSPRLFKTFEATGTNLLNCKLYLNSVSLGTPASATSTTIRDTALGTTRGFHWLIAEDTLTGMRCSTSSRIYIKNTQLDTVLLGRP